LKEAVYYAESEYVYEYKKTEIELACIYIKARNYNTPLIDVSDR